VNKEGVIFTISPFLKPSIGVGMTFIIVVLLARCTPPPPQEIVPPRLTNAIHAFFSSPPCEAKKAGGTISLKLQGQRYKCPISFYASDAQTVSCDIYSPWGGIIAAIETTGSGGIISLDNQRFIVEADQNMRTIPYFTDFYFTFEELIRILEGSFYRSLYTQNNKINEIQGTRKYHIVRWHSEYGDIQAKIKRGTHQMSEIKLKPDTHNPYTIIFHDFDTHSAKKIIFEENENNYFSLEWDKIVCL